MDRKTIFLGEVGLGGEVRSVSRLEKRLREAEERLLEELRQSDRRKDEFLATLAHELRNPLAPIIMAGDMLEKISAAHPQLPQIQQLQQIAQQYAPAAVLPPGVTMPSYLATCSSSVSLGPTLFVLLGSAESLCAFDTCQVDDYSKVMIESFDPVHKAKRRAEVRPRSDRERTAGFQQPDFDVWPSPQSH